MSQWEKLGRIFCPDGEYPWMHSHAQLPVSLSLGNNRYRVYFASRTKEQYSHIAYVEFDINEPKKILSRSETPVLKPGPWGHFDDHGVYPSSFVTYDNKIYMYYIGWVQGTPAPLFYAKIGLAISEDRGATFQRYSTTPVMGCSEYDPCLVTSPEVMFDNGVWRMWYVSGFRWEETPKGLASYYHIKYAESDDGINWRRTGHVAIDLKDNEKNIARPSVIKRGNLYQMWYSYVPNSTRYHIGYAESDDGINWQRKDNEAGIEVSESGWDSEMIAYPQVFVHDNKRYMLYNGNGFGRTGFGLAVETD